MGRKRVRGRARQNASANPFPLFPLSHVKLNSNAFQSPCRPGRRPPAYIMNRKIVGVILLIAAGVVLAICTVGAQVAYAIVRGGFYAGRMTGLVPPGPEAAFPHWLVI